MKEGNMVWIIAVLVLGLVIVTGLYALNSGTSYADMQTIAVTETAEQEVMPDEAQVYIEIRTRADGANDAKTQNADISEDVLNALQDYGIAEEDIETTSYYLNEETKWDKEAEEYVVTGYILTHIMKVTTSDIENAGEIIDAAVDAGATGVDNVQFTLSKDKESEMKTQLLAEAAQKAKAKAETLVEAVDADLGDIVTMSESSYYNPIFRYAAAYDMSALSFEEKAETSISPEQLTVSATVSITYEIEE
jgi:uncharacterized protein YggE